MSAGMKYGGGRPLAAAAVVGSVFITAALAGAAILNSSDALPREIGIALRPIERLSAACCDLIIVDGPTVAGQGFQIGFVVFLLGGIPAAIASIVLAARTRRGRTRWREEWSQVFQAGFVFQACSFLCGFVLSALLLLAWALTAERSEERRVGKECTSRW